MTSLVKNQPSPAPTPKPSIEELDSAYVSAFQMHQTLNDIANSVSLRIQEEINDLIAKRQAEHAKIFADAEVASQVLEQATKDLRSAGLAAYAADDSSKTVSTHCKVRVMQTPKIHDTETMFMICRQEYSHLLQLDTKRVLKAIKAEVLNVDKEIAEVVLSHKTFITKPKS